MDGGKVMSVKLPPEEERRAIRIASIMVGTTRRISLSTTKLSELEKGDLFFLEEPGGELVVDDAGGFLFKTQSNPQLNELGFWGVETDTIA